jgi:hypothetical protein
MPRQLVVFDNRGQPKAPLLELSWKIGFLAPRGSSQPEFTKNTKRQVQRIHDQETQVQREHHAQ